MGYVDMGGWIGGQAEYVMVPYADFNLLKFPDKAQAMDKIRDLTCLSDILPTGFHGAVTAKVGVGSTVYVAGAGPVGLAAAASARILGAAAVLIGDMNTERLAHAKNVGFEPIDLTMARSPGRAGRGGPRHSGGRLRDRLRRLRGQGASSGRQSRRSAGCGSEQPDGDHPGSRCDRHSRPVRDRRPGAKEQAAKSGNLSLRLGLGWAKSHSLHTGQTPVLKYNRQLMQAILWNKLPIAEIVNVKVINLEEAPEGYNYFDAGVAAKFVIDPHGQLSKAA